MKLNVGNGIVIEIFVGLDIESVLDHLSRVKSEEFTQ